MALTTRKKKSVEALAANQVMEETIENTKKEFPIYMKRLKQHALQNDNPNLSLNALREINGVIGVRKDEVSKGNIFNIDKIVQIINAPIKSAERSLVMSALKMPEIEAQILKD